MSAIESTLVENRVFHPSEDFANAARVSGMAGYEALCAEAEQDADGFWAKRAREQLVWSKPFTRTLDESNAPFYTWFDDGELNASANCLDRHMGTDVENKTAIIFEADGGQVTKVTFKELLARVSQFANALRKLGVQKGDRVLVYMPMTIEGVVAMQACARIGATHSVVFGGFSAKAALPMSARWLWSQPTTRCGAAKSCRSKPLWTRPSPWAAVSACAMCWCLSAPLPPATWLRAAT
jgi:acetyl-CoA synthetase